MKRLFVFGILKILFLKGLLASNILLTIAISNISESNISIFRKNEFGGNEFLFKNKIKGEKTIVVSLDLKKAELIFLNSYIFYVRPGDTINIIYKNKFNTGHPELTASGKNNEFYTFFYSLDTSGYPIQNTDLISSNGQWLSYKMNLKEKYQNHKAILRSFCKINNCPLEFYKIADKEICYRYFINCLYPNYSRGINQGMNKNTIPSFFYDDIKISSIDKPYFFSGSFITFLRLYNLYLTDSKTGFRLSRLQSVYFDSLYENITLSFPTDLHLIMKLNILQEYSLSDQGVLLPSIQARYAELINELKGREESKYVDSIFRHSLVINKPFSNKVRESLLITINTDTISFAKFLDRFRHKIIYIDFWATWCLPCIKGIPEIIKLKNRYQSSDIEFVFLSLDSKESLGEWVKMSQELSIIENQFLLLGDWESELSKYLHIGALPHYAIVNRNGELIFASAPAPNSERGLKEIDLLIGN